MKNIKDSSGILGNIISSVNEINAILQTRSEANVGDLYNEDVFKGDEYTNLKDALEKGDTIDYSSLGKWDNKIKDKRIFIPAIQSRQQGISNLKSRPNSQIFA